MAKKLPFAKIILLNGEMRESAWYSEMEFLGPLYESDQEAEFHVSKKMAAYTKVVVRRSFI